MINEGSELFVSGFLPSHGESFLHKLLSNMAKSKGAYSP